MQNDKQKIIRDKTLPKSIRSVVRMYPSNQVNRLFYGGLPHLGNALWGPWSSSEIQEAAEAYENYSLSLNLLIKGFTIPRAIRKKSASLRRFFLDKFGALPDICRVDFLKNRSQYEILEVELIDPDLFFRYIPEKIKRRVVDTLAIN